MLPYADLELSLHRLDAASYQVDFRFSQPESEADVRLPQNEQARAVFDLEKLSGLLYDPDEYAAELTRCLFDSESLRTAFAQARTSAQSQNAALRLRLFIGASAPELHGLCWELLRDPQGFPQSNISLATDANILFSRYLSSLDWRPVRLKPRGELKALVAVAAPSDVKNYKLAEIDRDEEIERAEKGLGETSKEKRVLPRATLNDLIAEMREFAPDVLYLVAHGYFANGQPVLVLEDENGKADFVKADEIVVRFRELESLPRLVVLVSCQSGGKPGESALAALGPRLAEIGVPAVLAMQDNLSMETAAQFIPAFFRELQRDGQIDRAVSVARGMVRERPDAWIPVLTTRLKSGRLWYTPGFRDSGKGFEKFPAQIQNIKSRHLTPILGPGLVDGLLDSPQQIARNWAETFHYPMAPHERESLPQVAQFLTINQQKSFPYEDLMNYLRKRVQEHFREKLPPELLEEQVPCWQVLDAAGKLQRENNPNEPHRALAALPLEIYLTANADTLLEGALKEAGKKPQARFCPWNDYTAEAESARDDDTYSVDRPLVYHLFGLWSERPSLVLTEDNYFDFLLGMARNKALIPLQVKKAMTDSGLLFLGFQTHEWQFRVLFRAMLSLPGQRYDEYANIAAQVEPEDGRILEPQRAREYLEQYFFKGCKLDLSIYWGTPDDFIKELMQYWRRQA